MIFFSSLLIFIHSIRQNICKFWTLSLSLSLAAYSFGPHFGTWRPSRLWHIDILGSLCMQSFMVNFWHMRVLIMLDCLFMFLKVKSVNYECSVSMCARVRVCEPLLIFMKFSFHYFFYCVFEIFPKIIATTLHGCFPSCNECCLWQLFPCFLNLLCLVIFISYITCPLPLLVCFFNH